MITFKVFFIVFVIGYAVLSLFLFSQIRYKRKKPYREIYRKTALKELRPILVKVINKYLGEQTKLYNLVELGAGLATVSKFLAQKFEWKDTYAIDEQNFLVFFGNLYQKLHKQPIKFIKTDMYTYKIPAKSLVYCFLNNKQMTKLYTDNLLAGHIIISVRFTIDGVEPTEKYKLRDSFQQCMYVYDFR